MERAAHRPRPHDETAVERRTDVVAGRAGAESEGPLRRDGVLPLYREEVPSDRRDSVGAIGRGVEGTAEQQ
ncbi:hypothetical protein L3i23_18300 [Herbiconiux sp. L3-i23]|nr:hypothetical protein [Herbiconiux sp. L3-i23]BDI23054.1 hypothetical protein L3i23_18300 [Herbiconiux sp. L3-i23]